VARNFRELEAKLEARMGPEKWAAHQAQIKAEIVEIRNMEELREARSMTQTQLAAKLKISQGAVSRVERRADMYISTLRDYLRAMGGDVQIRAIFPNGEVILSQFQDLDFFSSSPVESRATSKRTPSSRKPLPRRARVTAAGM